MSSESRKAQKIEVPRDARARTLAHAALSKAIAQMVANEEGARGDRDPEATHQLRVGVRRLRVVLRQFAPLLGEAALPKLQDELRWVFQKLGAVRDYDVLIENAAGRPPAAGIEPLQQALVRERDEAGRAAVSALESDRYRELVHALAELEREAARKADKKASPKARKWLKKRLDKRLTAVLSRTDAIAGDDEPALHELRKQLKKLRYTADLARGLWGDKRTARYLKCLSKLQDVLGPINDAAVGRALLEELKEGLDSEAVDAANTLADELDQRVARNLKSLPRAFEKLADKQPFWH